MEDSVNEMIEDLEREDVDGANKIIIEGLQQINECRREMEAIRTRLHETETLLKRLQQIEIKQRVKLNKLWVSTSQKILNKCIKHKEKI